MSKPSRAIMLFGTEEPVPETPRLEAGPLSCTLDAGNLRHIRLAGREAIRAISFIVRDRNWGTYNPAITDLYIHQGPEGFLVTYDAVCRDATQEFRYRSRIEGRPTGELVFRAEGEAVTDFLTCRTGFVVLHGVEGVSGAPVEVLHVDGRVTRARFPELIDPDCPFRDIRALTHEVLPGVEVTCRMEGDTFEMEDQRNWTDASYKTYVRPLALPWPYTLRAGEKLSQQVSLEVRGALPATGAATAKAGSDAGAVRVEVGGATGRRMPPLGLAVPAEHAAAALEVADLIRMARPSFLVGHVDLRQPDGGKALYSYGQLAQRCGAELVIEAVIPCLDDEGRPTDDLAVMRRDLETLEEQVHGAGVSIGRIAVSPAADLKCTLPGGVWPKAPDLAALYAATRERFPGAAVGGGMFSYFTELNRKRPPTHALDFVCHTTCPLVHAGDDLSLTETLEALPSVFASVRTFAGGMPYWLFPTAISMRQNPYGAAPAENPGGIRVAMARVDPRERALIGAAWYAGYIAHAAKVGPDAVTLAAAAGPSGIVHTRLGWAQPWFDEVGAEVHPSFHVFHQHARHVGEPLLATTSSAPREVQCLALVSETGPRLWLVNLTDRPQEVAIMGLEGQRAHAHVIDEASFELLCLDAGAFDRLATECFLDSLELPPYATARIDAIV